MDLFLIQRLAVLLLHQSLIDGNPQLFRLGPDQAVALEPGEWSAIGSYFRQQTARSAKQLRWAIWLQVPVAIAILAIVSNFAWLADLADKLNSWASALAILAMTITLPVIAFARHNRAVLNVIAEIRSTLSSRPMVEVKGAQTSWHIVEIVFLLFFGYGVFVDVYGSLVPDAFRNTPWTGRHIGVGTIIGLMAFAAVLYRHFLRDRKSTEPRDSSSSAKHRR